MTRRAVLLSRDVTEHYYRGAARAVRGRDMARRDVVRRVVMHHGMASFSLSLSLARYIDPADGKKKRRPSALGHFFIAIDVEAFVGLDKFKVM